ncbi:MAG: Wzz/FepE/Etk N-terminal domain-containing protein [Candidatus Pelagadaptatus aseana]|uniref:GNVR domain-containing protein n=1 Tax=Candidatus Pelagadaptatus aseana TaxID=3120508 RepID=UPI0039B297EE
MNQQGDSPNNNNNYQDYRDDEIDLMELFVIMWQGKWLIVACTVLATLVGGGWLSLQKDVYSVALQYQSLTALESRSLFVEPEEFSELSELSELSGRLITDKEFQASVLDRSLSAKVKSPGRKSKVYGVTVETVSPDGMAEQLNTLVKAASKAAALNLIEGKRTALDRDIAAFEAQLQSEFVLEAESLARAELQKELILMRVQRATMDTVGDVEGINVVKWAFDPKKPVSPKRHLVMALSVVLGGMIGVFAVFIRKGVRSYRARSVD